MARRAESPVERAKRAVRANERSEWADVVTLSEASERTLLVTKSASLLYEIRTTRFFRMPKGEVNKVCWSLKTFYSAFVSLLVGVENFRSNGYREVCFSDPPFGPKIQTNSGHLPSYLGKTLLGANWGNDLWENHTSHSLVRPQVLKINVWTVH